MKEAAVKKLGAELNDKTAKWSAKAGAIKTAVHGALVTFCGQNEEFAQAVAQSDKTLWAVCEECVKNVGQSVSDLEVYRSAVAAYFPGAQVDCVMTVRMSEHENPSRDPERANSRTSGDVLSLDLFDLMG
jgi:hypothetical protein